MRIEFSENVQDVINTLAARVGLFARKLEPNEEIFIESYPSKDEIISNTKFWLSPDIKISSVNWVNDEILVDFIQYWDDKISVVIRTTIKGVGDRSYSDHTISWHPNEIT